MRDHQLAAQRRLLFVVRCRWRVAVLELRPPEQQAFLAQLLLAGYVVALARMQRLATERDAKVRYLPNGGGRGGSSLDARPQLLLQRSAN